MAVNNNDLDLDFEVEVGGSSETQKESLKDMFKDPFSHMRTGISYMLPYIMLGGILKALGILIRVFPDVEFFNMCTTLGSVGMNFFVPFFGAYIAYSIADKPGLAPGFVCSYIANSNGSGYLGALISGFMVGYLTLFLVKAIRPSKMFQQIWSMFAPVIACLIVGVFLLAVLTGPISAFTSWAAAGLSNLDSSQGAVLGAIMGVLDGIDYGGPISKIASTIAGAAFSEGITTFYGARISAIMVPPLGLMIASMIKPRLFTKSEREYSKSGILLTFIGGYTELALPIVLNDIIRCTIASFCGVVTASTIGGFFGQTLSVPAMGLPSWFFVGNIPAYILSIVAGTTVTCVLIILLKTFWKRKDFDPDAEDEMMSVL